jgi:predicted PurR-regulated permease PerM
MSSHLGRRRRTPALGEPEQIANGERPADPTPESPPVRRVKISLDQREIRIATIRILLIVSAWLVAAWVVGVAQHFLFLILLAWLSAIAAEPAIRFFLRRGLSRSRSTAIVGTVLILVIVGLAVLFERALFDQAAQLVQSLPATVTSVVDQLNST